MPTGDHDALTQTTGAIHPAAWVSATDPGAIGAHKLWIDTSTVVPFQLNKRNAGNTAWEEVGPSAITDPTTTRGDFITRDITSLVRLAVGANQTMLTSNGTDPSWSATPILSGLLTAVGIKTSGITGATGTVRVMGGTASGAPASGTFEQRDMVVDNAGSIYVCTVAGTPGTWVRVPSDVTTTRGDLVVRGASAIGRLAIGTSGSVLVSDGTDPSWDDSPTLVGLLTAAGLKTTGVTGAASAAALKGRTASGAPVTGTFDAGDIVPDTTGALWLCTVAGTPGTFVEVSGTGSSSSSSGATGGGALVPIQAFGPLTGSQSTFSFTVPSGYRNLELVVSGRSTAAVQRTQVTVIFNGDTTAANYISQLENSSGASVTAAPYTSTAGAVIGQFPGTSATNTSRPGAVNVWIPNYVGTTWQKALFALGVHHDGSTSTMTQSTAAHWLDTSAIASMTVGLVNGNFEIGSYACLYGERESIAPSAGALEVSSVFQSTKIDGTGSITTTSTSFGVIDNTDLPAKTMYLLGGDIVKLTIQCQSYNSGSNLTAFDFQVVQPTSGTVRANANAENGAGVMQGTIRTPVYITTTFTAVETGIHTFQPLWRVAGGTATLSNATSGNDDAIALFTVEKIGALQIPYMHYQDQKATNTAGGTFTSGAWQTRTLNTEVSDTHSLVTLASNQLALPAGTYRARGSGCVNMVGFHQLRIQDVTNATTLALGTNNYAHVSANGNNVASVTGRFTLSAAATIELQHRCGTTRSTDGFGAQANWGTEVYANLELWKES